MVSSPDIFGTLPSRFAWLPGLGSRRERKTKCSFRLENRVFSAFCFLFIHCWLTSLWSSKHFQNLEGQMQGALCIRLHVSLAWSLCNFYIEAFSLGKECGTECMCRILKWDFNHRTNQQHTEHILKIVSVFLDILRSLSLRETIQSRSQSKQLELSRQPVYFKLESWSLKPFTSSSEGHSAFPFPALPRRNRPLQTVQPLQWYVF